MPRRPRMDFEGAFHHLYNRGNRRERIYGDGADYERFEEFMIEAMNWSGIRLYAWCLMPNHFHLLVESLEANVEEFMRRLLTRYAKAFNRRYHLVGHVFQSRFKSILCDKESYFLELVRYIHLNPYRVKQKGFVGKGGWKWSSHRHYIGQVEPPEGMKTSIQEILSRFGKTPSEARKRYAQFLADGMQEESWEDFYKPKGNAFLGNEGFIERAKHRAGEPTREEPRAWKRLESVEALAEEVARHLGVSPEEMRSTTQKRHLSRTRQAFAYIGRRYYRFPATTIAKYLGRDVSAVSQMMARLKDSGKENVEIAMVVKALGRNGA